VLTSVREQWKNQDYGFEPQALKHTISARFMALMFVHVNFSVSKFSPLIQRLSLMMLWMSVELWELLSSALLPMESNPTGLVSWMRPAAVLTLSSTSSSPRSGTTQKQTTLQKRYVLLLHVTGPVNHNKRLNLECEDRPLSHPCTSGLYWLTFNIGTFFSLWVMWKVIWAQHVYLLTSSEPLC